MKVADESCFQMSTKATSLTSTPAYHTCFKRLLSGTYIQGFPTKADALFHKSLSYQIMIKNIGNLSFFNSVGIKSDKLLLHCIGCVVCDSPLTEIQYANLARRTASDTSICPFAVLASKNTNIL